MTLVKSDNYSAELPNFMVLSRNLSVHAGINLATSGDKAGVRFNAPKAGTIDVVYFRIGAKTTNDTVTGGLYDLGTDGFPDTTSPVTAGSEDTGIVVDTAEKIEMATLATGAIVTQGQEIAFALTQGAVGDFDVDYAQDVSAVGAQIAPVAVDEISGVWSTATSSPVPAIAVLYNGDTFVTPIMGALPPNTSQDTMTWNNGSGNIERGCVFEVNQDCSLTGLMAYLDSNFNTFEVKVYSGVSTLLNTTSVEEDGAASSSGGRYWIPLDAIVNLVRGTTYRAVVVPTSASSLLMQGWNLGTGNSALLGGFPGQGTMKFTQGAPPTWVDTDTRVIHVQPVIGKYEDGAGGGGGGGMRLVGDGGLAG